MSFHLSVTIAGLLSLIAGIIFSPPVVPLPAVFTILVIFFCLQLYSPIQLLNGGYYLTNILLLGLAFLVGLKLASLMFLLGIAGRTVLSWLVPRTGEQRKSLSALIGEAGFLTGANLFPLLVTAVIFGWHDGLGLAVLDFNNPSLRILGSTLAFGLIHGLIFWFGSRLKIASRRTLAMTRNVASLHGGRRPDEEVYDISQEIASPISERMLAVTTTSSKARWDLLVLILLELLPALFFVYTLITFPIFDAEVVIILGTITTFLSILLNYLSAPRLELERRIHELSAMNAISKTLSSVIDLDRLLSSIQAQVAEILNVENFYVALSDFQNQELWYPLAVKGGQRQNWPRRKFLDRLTDRVIQEGKPILIPEHAEQELSRIGLPAGEDSPYAWIGVPLIAADRVTGCLAAFSLSPEVGFSDEDLHLLSTLAGQTSVGIEVILIRDVTREIENLEARELLGETLVHDLRSPISSVISALEMIQDAHSSGDPTNLIGPSLQIARRSAKRVLAMIESLLEITRLQAGKLKLDITPVEIRSLVDSCLAEFVSQARDNDVSIENSVPRGLPSVPMDRGKIFRVLNNLVDNALKFTREQGEVRITAEISSEGDLQVRVNDAGPGIPEEYRQKIFERFTQIPGQLGRRKGSGLGLTYCRLAVEAHQGRIWVEPRAGGGSIFVFTLPLNR